MATNYNDLIVFGGGNAISTAIDCGAAGMNIALVERGPPWRHLPAPRLHSLEAAHRLR